MSTPKYSLGEDGHSDRSHYGLYGENCLRSGQFDAGECSLCQIRKVLKNDDIAPVQKLQIIKNIMMIHEE